MNFPLTIIWNGSLKCHYLFFPTVLEGWMAGALWWGWRPGWFRRRCHATLFGIHCDTPRRGSINRASLHMLSSNSNPVIYIHPVLVFVLLEVGGRNGSGTGLMSGGEGVPWDLVIRGTRAGGKKARTWAPLAGPAIMTYVQPLQISITVPYTSHPASKDPLLLL